MPNAKMTMIWRTHTLTIIICTALATAFSFKSSAQSNRLWATYYGGAGDDRGVSVATDPSGNVYLAGFTDDTSGIASGGFQNSFGGGINDAFLVKFDASGNRLWATYYGGAGDDWGYYVQADFQGNVYLTGATNSTSSIASSGFQNSFGGGTYDAFLVKFDASGNRLWATYYGGSSYDQGMGITIDQSGKIYLGGITSSTSLIASGGFQNSFGGSNDAFIVKFDSNGSRLWGTYYGGINDDRGYATANDKLGNVYLAGWTGSTTAISSPNGFQISYGGGTFDNFLAKFDSLGNRIWGTYYGGSDWDWGTGVAVDISNNVYLSGYTKSSNGIAFGGFQNTIGSPFVYDAFVVKFDASGNQLWGTYYGGGASDECVSVATDTLGNVYLGGESYSTSGIASNGFQNSLIGTENEMVVKFDSLGNRLCSTYYGGGHDENGHVVIDKNGNVYLAGETNSSSNIASGGFQNVFGGMYDTYLVKFSSCLEVGIENDNSFPRGTTIYPNPVNQSATIKFDNPQNENCSLTIYGAHGQPVWSISDITTDKIKIDRRNLITGLYFFQLRTDRQIIGTGKFVITD